VLKYKIYELYFKYVSSIPAIKLQTLYIWTVYSHQNNDVNHKKLSLQHPLIGAAHSLCDVAKRSDVMPSLMITVLQTYC